MLGINRISGSMRCFELRLAILRGFNTKPRRRTIGCMPSSGRDRNSLAQKLWRKVRAGVPG